MRNLKKVLALALALVMAMSMFTFANAAFPDSDTANPVYNEAVEVLSALEVFEGKPGGNFDYTGNIKRSEVAAILYRITTGNVGVDGKVAANIHANYTLFPDVPSTSWYAGYVNYCANAKWITGHANAEDATIFKPDQNITGYQTLAMILRAIGYGKEGELEGSDWWYYTAKYGQELGITRNVTDTMMNSPASRQVVAELLFRAALVPTVKWNMLQGYTPEKVLAASGDQAVTNGGISLGNNSTDAAGISLGADVNTLPYPVNDQSGNKNTYKVVYDLGAWGHIRELDNVDNQGNVYANLLYNVFSVVGSVPSVDGYGRPVMNWVKDGTANTFYTDGLHHTLKYLPDLGDLTGATTGNGRLVTSVRLSPKAVYTTKVTECDITKQVNDDRTMTDVAEFYNGGVVEDSTTGYARLRPFDVGHTTADTVGAQGRYTEVYKINRNTFTPAYQNAYSDEQSGSKIVTMGEWVVVYYDIMLATVTGVTPAEYDTAGHKVRDAQVTYEVGDVNGHDPDDTDHGFLFRDTIDGNYAVNDLILVSTSGMKTVYPDSSEVVDPEELVNVDSNGVVEANSYGALNLPYLRDNWGDVTIEGRASSARVTVNGTLGPAMGDVANYNDAAKSGRDAHKTGITTTTGQTYWLNHSYDRAYAVMTSGTGADDYRPSSLVAGNLPVYGVTTLTRHGLYTPVGNNVINKSYTLYLDENHNILGMIGDTVGSNVGMILSVAGKRAGTGYVTEAQVLLGDGTTTTLNFVNTDGGNYSFFTTLHDAEVQESSARAFALDIVPNAFVEFGTTTINGETYHTVTEDTSGGDTVGTTNKVADGRDSNSSIVLDHTEDGGTTYFSEFDVLAAQHNSTDLAIDPVGTSGNITVVEPGISNILVSGTSNVSGNSGAADGEGEFSLSDNAIAPRAGTALVDDNTVFFVAKFVFDYTDTTGHGNQVLQDWNVYKGFKNLPKLVANSISSGGYSDILFAVHDSDTRYVAIGARTDNSSGTPVKHSFSMYAPDAVGVDNSYLVLSRAVTYQYYSTYNVVRDGKMDVVRVSDEVNKQMDEAIANNAMVTFGGMSGDGYYTTVQTVSDSNMVGANGATPLTLVGNNNRNYHPVLGQATIPASWLVGTGMVKKGVLIVNQTLLPTDTDTDSDIATGTAYLTLADDCKVMIVNRVHNQLHVGTLDSIAQYERGSGTGSSRAFAYEVDTNGYVTYLYIID